MRGREQVFGGEWVVGSAGNASHIHCAVPFFLCPKRNRGGERRSSAGNAWRSLRVCIGAAWGSESAREGSEKVLGQGVAVRGRATAFGGEWVVRSAGFNALSPQQHARTRIIIYVRPARAVKLQPWGRKTPPASTHRPPNDVRPCRSNVHTSAPAFTLPPHSLRRRPRRLRHPAAAVIHNGLSTEKLSTSLPAALCKTFSPSRLRTRIYNISFARRPLPGRVRAAPEKSPRRCGTVSRAAVRRVGGGRRQRRTPPRAVPNHAACVPNHCVQRRKCTGPTPPLPVCSPRGNLPTASPPPVDGRTAVRKGGSAQGNPRSCPCVLPATACLRPRPRRLCAESPSAKAECTRQSPPLPVRSPRVSPPKTEPPPADGRSAVRPSRAGLSTAAPLPVDDQSAERRVGEGEGKGRAPSHSNPPLSAYRRAPAV